MRAMWFTRVLQDEACFETFSAFGCQRVVESGSQSSPMIKKQFSVTAALGAIFFFTLAMAAIAPAAAQTTQAGGKKPSSKAGAATSEFVKTLGDVIIDSEQNVITPAGIVYTHAHMHAENGATMDCDELRGNSDKSGNITQFIATGNVVAHVPFAKDQTYDISADKAVYDPSTHQIDLTGKPVTATAETPYTKGPVVQTGDSGVVILGPSPNYPKTTDFPTILMNKVHTQFSPKEQPGRTSHADFRQEPN